MTIFSPGDQVFRRGDVQTGDGGERPRYIVEERTGDQYRVTQGEGDQKYTLFHRGYELEAAPSSEVAKPEADHELEARAQAGEFDDGAAAVAVASEKQEPTGYTDGGPNPDYNPDDDDEPGEPSEDAHRRRG